MKDCNSQHALGYDHGQSVRGDQYGGNLKYLNQNLVTTGCIGHTLKQQGPQTAGPLSSIGLRDGRTVGSCIDGTVMSGKNLLGRHDDKI